MPAHDPRLTALSADDRRALDHWLVEFDHRWEDGLLASRVDQIPPGSSWRLPALAEMVKIDLERQWECGREITLESYLEQFPELGAPDDVSADLIQAEYEVRKQFGAPVALDDYLRRFPHQAAELGRLIAQGQSSLSPRSSSSGTSRSSSSPSQAKGARPKPDPFPRPFGRYQLLKRLGEGGMGSVFLAEDTTLGRRVALKIPLFGPEDGPEGRERFYREARAAATLDHQYLCPVFDVGEIEGRLYLTMAYIEGKSLAELIRGEGLPPRHVAALVGKLALALDVAHAQGVIHRDLKPANVMIRSTGSRREPVIVDFGLARRDDGDEVRVTKTGQVMGTLGYMAPEQIRGDKAMGPACDIYALGVMLYELLSGQLPFTGTGLAVAGKILTQAPLPLTAHRPDLDPRLEAICLKAMARKIEDRYPSMSALAAALTDYLKAATTTVTASTGASAPPRPADAVRESGGHSMVGKLLDQLADTAVSPPPSIATPPRPIPAQAPKPVASAILKPRSRRLPWPLMVAGTFGAVILVGIFGIVILGMVINVATKSVDKPSEPPVAGPLVNDERRANEKFLKEPPVAGSLVNDQRRANEKFIQAPPVADPLVNDAYRANEKFLKDILEKMTQMGNLLASIHDQRSAQQVSASVQSLANDLMQSETKAKSLPPLTEEQDNQLGQKYQASIQAAKERVERETARVEAINGTRAADSSRRVGTAQWQ
jgi:serine/threonine protein kinase